MADYLQRDGEYPRLDRVPDIVNIYDNPVPYTFYRQKDNEYPYIANIPDMIPMSSPTPYLFYVQDTSYDGYPHLDFPKMYSIFSRPVPFIYQDPDDGEDSYQFDIILTDYVHTIPIKNFCNMIKVD